MDSRKVARWGDLASSKSPHGDGSTRVLSQGSVGSGWGLSFCPKVEQLIESFTKSTCELSELHQLKRKKNTSFKKK